MKKIILLVSILTASFALAQEAQVQRESKVLVSPTADLKGSEVRWTVREFGLDRKLTLNVEIRNAGGNMVDKKVVTLTAEQVKTWVNDADPDASLQATVLAAVGLSKR